MSKVGRPSGYRLSEASKRAIAETKKGQSHRPETKDKISRSLTIYFKQFDSLGEEIVDRYCSMEDDYICEWANQVKNELDNLDDVYTEKRLRNKCKMEICCGHDIERFSHGLTPEFIIILKQLLAEHDDAQEILENLFL